PKRAEAHRARERDEICGGEQRRVVPEKRRREDEQRCSHPPPPLMQRRSTDSEQQRERGHEAQRKEENVQPERATVEEHVAEQSERCGNGGQGETNARISTHRVRILPRRLEETVRRPRGRTAAAACGTSRLRVR